MAEKYFDDMNNDVQITGKRHQQKSMDGYNRLPCVFTKEDVASIKRLVLWACSFRVSSFIVSKRKSKYWLHFAVRPKDNRRKTMFLQK